MTHKNTNLIFFDPGDEETFPLARAPKSIDRSYWRLHEWATKGRLSVTGEIVQLEVCNLPSGLGSTLGAYRRFIARLNGKETS